MHNPVDFFCEDSWRPRPHKAISVLDFMLTRASGTSPPPELGLCIVAPRLRRATIKKRTAIVAVILTMSLTLAACGGDEGGIVDEGDAVSTTTNSASDSTAPPETEPTTETTGATESNGPPVNATWEINGESTDVAIVFCGFEGETGNDNVLFSMRAQALGSDGQPSFTFDGTIIDIGSGPIHALSVWEGGSTASPPIYEQAPQSPAEWQVDGSSVRFESEFVDTDVTPVGTGVFEGECP